MNLLPNLTHPYFSFLQKRKLPQERLQSGFLIMQTIGLCTLAVDLILEIVSLNLLPLYLALILKMKKFQLKWQV